MLGHVADSAKVPDVMNVVPIIAYLAACASAPKIAYRRLIIGTSNTERGRAWGPAARAVGAYLQVGFMLMMKNPLKTVCWTSAAYSYVSRLATYQEDLLLGRRGCNVKQFLTIKIGSQSCGSSTNT